MFLVAAYVFAVVVVFTFVFVFVFVFVVNMLEPHHPSSTMIVVVVVLAMTEVGSKVGVKQKGFIVDWSAG